MCIGNYSTDGYVLPIIKLHKLFTQTQLEQLKALVCVGDYDDLTDFFEANLPKKFPDFRLYYPAEDDEVSDVMEKGVWYIVFEKDDLFIQTPTKGYKMLEELDMKPTHAEWNTN